MSQMDRLKQSYYSYFGKKYPKLFSILTIDAPNSGWTENGKTGILIGHFQHKFKNSSLLNRIPNNVVIRPNNHWVDTIILEELHFILESSSIDVPFRIEKERVERELHYTMPINKSAVVVPSWSVSKFFFESKINENNNIGVDNNVKTNDLFAEHDRQHQAAKATRDRIFAEMFGTHSK